MKKLLILVLALVMVLSLSACGGGKTDPAPSGSGTTAPGASQPGQADEQTENSLINAPDESWFSSTTSIAYVFLTDGKYESYSLIDGIWESNGDGTYKLNADSLTIDSTTHPVSVTDDTLTFTINNIDYVYEKTSPFNPDNPEQSSEGSLDEKLVLPDGQAWIWENNGVITGYVFKSDGTYSYHATDTWILQSSGTWSTSGDALELEHQGKQTYTYVINSDGLTLTDFFDDVYGPYAAQDIPAGN